MTKCLQLRRAAYKWSDGDEKGREEEEEEEEAMWPVDHSPQRGGGTTADADGVPHECPAGRASKVPDILTLDYPIKRLIFFFFF